MYLPVCTWAYMSLHVFVCACVCTHTFFLSFMPLFIYLILHKLLWCFRLKKVPANPHMRQQAYLPRTSCAQDKDWYWMCLEFWESRGHHEPLLLLPQPLPGPQSIPGQSWVSELRSLAFSSNSQIETHTYRRTHTQSSSHRQDTDTHIYEGLPCGSDGKETVCSVGDLGSVPGLERSPGGGHGNPLQCSCLENPRGQRSLVSSSPWGCKESNTTEQLSKQHTRLEHLGITPPTWLIRGLEIAWKARFARRNPHFPPNTGLALGQSLSQADIGLHTEGVALASHPTPHLPPSLQPPASSGPTGVTLVTTRHTGWTLHDGSHTRMCTFQGRTEIPAPVATATQLSAVASSFIGSTYLAEAPGIINRRSGTLKPSRGHRASWRKRRQKGQSLRKRCQQKQEPSSPSAEWRQRSRPRLSAPLNPSLAHFSHFTDGEAEARRG